MTATAVVVVRAVPPTDPLGTVDQDPEAVRTEACKLVARDATCTGTTLAVPDRDSATPSGAAAGLNVATLLLWVALLAGLLLLVVLAARALARREARRPDDEGDDDGSAEIEEVEPTAVVVDRRREPLNWRREADEHRRAGRYRDALRCRYRALVGDLARRGLIDEIPGRTTGEERAQLHGVSPAAARPFDRAADLFDGAWYGDVAVDAADDDTFVALEREVLDVTARVPA